MPGHSQELLKHVNDLMRRRESEGEGCGCKGFPCDQNCCNSVVQGYRPQVDWGGDSGSATIVVGGHNVRVATSGWRRRCLYMLLLALLALSVVNLSITLWILKTVYFNVDGMGHLNVVRGGLEMQGASEFSQKISAARIFSRKEKDLPIKGYYNLTIHTTEFNGSINKNNDLDADGAAHDQPLNTHPSYLHISVKDMLAGTKGFTVRDESGKELFHADRSGTTVGANTFTVSGSRGAEVDGSVQTPNLYSADVYEFRLESVTRDAKIRSKDELNVEARNGDISAICTRSASLVAREGAIRFDNPKILMPLLWGKKELDKMLEEMLATEERQRTSTPSPQETQVLPPPHRPPSFETTTTPMPPTEGGGKDRESSASETVEVFQVCVCPSGKLFVVKAEYACVHNSTDVCP